MPDRKVHDLRQFMLQATNEISAEYRRIRESSSVDPGTAGDEGEENWAELFRDWLPANFHVATKGQIIASDGRLSPQVDVVVLEPSYPRKLRSKRKWLSDGVVAAFECKNTLTAAHVTDAVKRCVRFKELYAPRVGTPKKELTSPLIYGLLAHSHSWQGPASQPIDNIEHAASAASATVTHPRFLIDLICVADLATWAAAYLSCYAANMAGAWEAQFQAAFGGAFGVGTIQHRFDQAMQNDEPGFTPLGVLVAQIAQRMAWRDTSLQGFAAYAGIANANGKGYVRPWGLDVYSPTTREGVEAGKCTNGWPGEDRWAGWDLIGP